MIKKIIALLLSLLIMVLVIMGMSFYFFKEKVVNLNTYHTALEEIEAGLTVQIKIENALIDLMLANNMPTDWVRDLVQVEVMQNRLHQNIEGIYNAFNDEEMLQIDIDVDELIAVFEQRVNDYLQTEDKYLEPSDIESLEVVKSEMSKIISNHTKILNPTVLSNSGTVSKISSLVQEILNLPIIPIILGAITFIAFILQLVFFKSWDQGLRYTGIGILSGGLCFVILGFSAKLSGFYQNPMIQQGYVKDLITHLGETFFTYFYQMGLWISLIGILFLIPYLVCSYQQFVKES